MLNRIFKTILVLSLCVGISLPTNAAVSVSDGSAFVTKAEFAADLNNLSNRMAQLENSLDAKIDSLVSSYLTRNGIWNGSKQQILQSYYDLEQPSLTKLKANTAHDLKQIGSKKAIYISDKSGMAMTSYTYKSISSSVYKHSWGYISMSFGANDLYDNGMVLSNNIIDQDDIIKSSIVLGSATGCINRTSNSTWNLLVAVPEGGSRLVHTYFVSKGDSIYFQLRCNGTIYSTHDNNSLRHNGEIRLVDIETNIY